MPLNADIIHVGERQWSKFNGAVYPATIELQTTNGVIQDGDLPSQLVSKDEERYTVASWQVIEKTAIVNGMYVLTISATLRPAAKNTNR